MREGRLRQRRDMNASRSARESEQEINAKKDFTIPEMSYKYLPGDDDDGVGCTADATPPSDESRPLQWEIFGSDFAESY